MLLDEMSSHSGYPKTSLSTKSEQIFIKLTLFMPMTESGKTKLEHLLEMF